MHPKCQKAKRRLSEARTEVSCCGLARFLSRAVDGLLPQLTNSRRIPNTDGFQSDPPLPCNERAFSSIPRNNRRVPHIPDFLWSFVGSLNFMRLSLKRGAHAVLSRAAYRKFGASRSSFARCGILQASPSSLLRSPRVCTSTLRPPFLPHHLRCVTPPNVSR